MAIIFIYNKTLFFYLYYEAEQRFAKQTQKQYRIRFIILILECKTANYYQSSAFLDSNRS